MNKMMFGNIKGRRTRTTDSGHLLALISAFLDGATTDAQEAELFDYFGAAPAPDADARLERYRPMMAWYAALPGRRRAAGRRRRRMFVAMGAAASLAVALAVGAFLFFRSPSPANEAMELYAGSYVVRNGHRITDLRVIYPELLAAECLSDSLIAASESCESRAEEVERALIEQIVARIGDPELAEDIRADFFME